MTEQKHLPYGHQSINDDDIKAVKEALCQEIITRGSSVREFERAIAEYCGAKYAVSFCNASCALAASYQALDVGPQDRFFSTPNTFITSVSGATRFGVRPNFIDIDRSTGALDIEKLRSHVQAPLSRGKYVIAPVHFAGIAQDMQKLDSIFKTPDVVVVEDAAHALGSCYPDGTRVGSCAYSNITVFSFHPVKNITTIEGGMCTTNSEELYHKLRCIRDSGIEKNPDRLISDPAPWYYEAVEESLNFHMNDIQAALGISQLKRIDKFIEKRRAHVKRYRNHFKDVPDIKLFDERFDDRTAYHLMVVQIEFDDLGLDRSELMNILKDQGIGSQLHYIPVYRHPVYSKYTFEPETFEEMEKYYKAALSIPLFYDMTEQDVDRVANSILNVLDRKRKHYRL